MGLLESVIGGVVGQVFGGQRGQGGGAMSPLVKALLMLLLEKGVSGILGGGHASAPQPSGGAGPYGRDPGQHPSDAGGRETGDIGGFGQYRGPHRSAPDTDTGFAGDPSLPPGDFSDLSGMLGGGDDASSGPGRGQGSQAAAGGLDGLVESFHRGGLGDVMQSWIGPGANHPVASDQLAHALGPDTLDTLQSQTGLDRATLLSQLAQALPEVVHALTPQGRLPNAGER